MREPRHRAAAVPGHLGIDLDELDSSHVRRAFRAAIKEADGVDPAEWAPRELRHSFISLPVFGQRGAARRDLTVGRTLRDGSHGGGLPQADPDGPSTISSPGRVSCYQPGDQGSGCLLAAEEAVGILRPERRQPG